MRRVMKPMMESAISGFMVLMTNRWEDCFNGISGGDARMLQGGVGGD